MSRSTTRRSVPVIVPPRTGGATLGRQSQSRRWIVGQGHGHDGHRDDASLLEHDERGHEQDGRSNAETFGQAEPRRGRHSIPDIHASPP